MIEPESGGGALDLDAAYRDSEVGPVLAQLDEELVGLAPVKTRVRELAALLLIDRLRAQVGLVTEPPTLHMSFTGNPGTGKTTVALRMGAILKRLGYLRRGHLVAVTRDDLVGEYVGHTAPKTKEALRKAEGGVLFIDEAYMLYKAENERDYGSEAIEVLLTAMEERRADLVVVFAGYRDLMERFFGSNPGLRSRVGLHVDFPDYSRDELLAIGDLMLAGRGYHFDESAKAAFAEYLERRRTQDDFANARSVRNALDRARLRQANRLVARGGQVTREELATISAEDILASRLFRGSERTL
jgi:probable Rubsico expression protein CbbX